MNYVSLGLAGVSAIFLLSRKPRGHCEAAQWVPRSTVADVDAAVAKWEEALRKQPPTGDQYLIIGAGFLGCRIAHALLLRGERRIRFLDARRPRVLDDLMAKWGEEGLEFVCGDVTEPGQIQTAFDGVSTVFCTFAIIRYWERLKHQRELSHRINVGGTANVLEACRKAGVRFLIQTSTSNTSLLWEHKTQSGEPVVLDETSPYVEERNLVNHYGTSKAAAERLVLAANSSDLTTGSIRPCSGIFGPHDGLVLENTLRAKTAPPVIAPLQVSDWVFVDNVVWGHLLLEKELRAANPAAVGQAFAVSNAQPLRSLDFCRAIAHYEPSVSVVFPPIHVLRGLARIVEWISPFVTFPDSLKQLSTMTPSTMKLIETSYVYNIEKAKRVLGYEPMFTVDEGLLVSIRGFRESPL